MGLNPFVDITTLLLYIFMRAGVVWFLNVTSFRMLEKILIHSDLFMIIRNWEKGVTLVVSEPVCQSVGLSDWVVELLFVLLCNSWILLRLFC